MASIESSIRRIGHAVAATALLLCPETSRADEGAFHSGFRDSTRVSPPRRRFPAGRSRGLLSQATSPHQAPLRQQDKSR